MVEKHLEEVVGLDVVRGERLARSTSYRIGGPAALSITAHTYSALSQALSILDEDHAAWVVLGRGSNVLVSDEGYDGCVIRLGREFLHFSCSDEGQLTAGSGVQLSRLVAACQKEGLSGLEMCAGVPGSMGGAVSINAGTRSEWLGRRVVSVVTLRPGVGLRRYEASELEWGYRFSSLPTDEIILEVTLSLESANPSDIAYKMERRMAYRKRRQPLGKPSCGAVFRDPLDHTAHELIEACGLAGACSGDAQISDINANFVVNNGRATANDVLILISRMHDEVRKQHGIDMAPEVKFLGFK